MDHWKDKVGAFLKGPGWFPGTPRLGDSNAVPEVQNRAKYDPKVTTRLNMYVVFHFLLVFLAFENLSRYHQHMTPLSVLVVCGFLLWTLTSVGMLFDNSVLAWPLELLRSLSFLTIYYNKKEYFDFKMPSSAILIVTFSASVMISLLAIADRQIKKVK